MLRAMPRASIHWSLVAALVLCGSRAFAQADEPLPAPDEPPAAAGDEPAPLDDAPVAPEQAAQPEPMPEPAPRTYDEPPPPPPEPQPAPTRRYEGQVDSREAPAYSGDPEYDDEGDDYDSGESSGNGFEMPPWSIRVDPLNWLLDGKLGFELEVGVLDFMTVELVPIFVTNSEPPTAWTGLPDNVARESNGIGALAGTSVGAGFWLSGTPLRGYVLRAVLTNYGYTYESSDAAGRIDSVDVTERRFMGYLGSHNRIGIFTLAGAIGLGYELHQQQRCFYNSPGGPAPAVNGCENDDELQIALEEPSTGGFSVGDLNGWAHPIYLDVRLSLGLAFD